MLVDRNKDLLVQNELLIMFIVADGQVRQHNKQLIMT